MPGAAARPQLLLWVLLGTQLLPQGAAAAAATCPAAGEHNLCHLALSHSRGSCAAGRGSLQPPGPAVGCAAASTDAAASCPAAGSQPQRQHSRHIVRFRDYQMADAHLARLEAGLGPQAAGSWTWVPRHNAASRHPTDFGLISVADSAFGGLRAQLLAAPALSAWVRDIHPDREYRGRLQWQPEGPLGDLFADASSSGAAAAQPTRGGGAAHAAPLAQPPRSRTLLNGSLDASPAPPPADGEGAASSQQGGGGEGGGVTDNGDLFKTTKKPGRFSTRHTFDLEENKVGPGWAPGFGGPGVACVGPAGLASAAQLLTLNETETGQQPPGAPSSSFLRSTPLSPGCPARSGRHSSAPVQLTPPGPPAPGPRRWTTTAAASCAGGGASSAS